MIGQPDQPQTLTDCKCGHRRERHKLPQGRCKAVTPSVVEGYSYRCSCETYRPIDSSSIPDTILGQTPCDHCPHPFSEHYYKRNLHLDPPEPEAGCHTCEGLHHSQPTLHQWEDRCPGFHAGTVTTAEYDPSLPIVEPDDEPTITTQCKNCGHYRSQHDLDPADGPDYCAARGCKCITYVAPDTRETEMEEEPTKPVDEPGDLRAVLCVSCRHMYASHVIDFDGKGRDYCNVLDCLCRDFMWGRVKRKGVVKQPDEQPASQPAQLVSVIFHTDEYRGDHSAEVTIALGHKPGETVEELVQRAGGQKKNGVLAATDHIEIKLVQ